MAMVDKCFPDDNSESNQYMNVYEQEAMPTKANSHTIAILLTLLSNHFAAWGDFLYYFGSAAALYCKNLSCRGNLKL